MKININNGLLEPIAFLPSPHFNQRPPHISQGEIDLIVIHCISLPPKCFGKTYIHDFFQGKLDTNAHPFFTTIAELQVSSHLFINRLGDITQFVSFLDRAWHAGKSCWQERNNCNDFSIGIELEGHDDEIYTDNQYQQLILIIRLLMAYFPAITTDRIVGHSDIAKGRKTDPGPKFDWQYLRKGLS